MVYNFGGGLCSGYAANEYFNGSKFATEQDVIVPRAHENMPL